MALFNLHQRQSRIVRSHVPWMNMHQKGVTLHVCNTHAANYHLHEDKTYSPYWILVCHLIFQMNLSWHHKRFACYYCGIIGNLTRDRYVISKWFLTVCVDSHVLVVVGGNICIVWLSKTWSTGVAIFNLTTVPNIEAPQMSSPCKAILQNNHPASWKLMNWLCKRL